MRKFLFLLCVALSLGACQRETTSPVPALVTASSQPLVTYPTKALLVEAMTPVLVETTAEALPVWRQYAPGRPTLLLLASDPSLQPFP